MSHSKMPAFPAKSGMGGLIFLQSIDSAIPWAQAAGFEKYLVSLTH